MGSEMCIRDSAEGDRDDLVEVKTLRKPTDTDGQREKEMVHARAEESVHADDQLNCDQFHN